MGVYEEICYMYLLWDSNEIFHQSLSKKVSLSLIRQEVKIESQKISLHGLLRCTVHCALFNGKDV